MASKITPREALAIAYYGEFFGISWGKASTRNRSVCREVATGQLRDLRKLGFDVVARPAPKRKKTTR